MIGLLAVYLADKLQVGKLWQVTSNETWLLVGLGNPGLQYRNTRHNVGRAVVEAMAASGGEKFRRDSSGLMVADLFGSSPPRRLGYLAYATTFMNITGPQVAGFMRKMKIAPASLLVIHDDLDLSAHLLRLKMGGGEGGHNGLRSITAALGSKHYGRLRIGIGRPPGRMDAATYVLKPIPKAERGEWAATEAKAGDVALDVVVRGFTQAQQDLHSQN